MQTITYEEQQLMSIYAHGTRLELIETLNDMRTYLDQDEQELKALTDSAIAKLNAMSDIDFENLDLVPDFN
ncbi:MAG: transposon-transfer assisting family protein [Oscillospiraceae bacterium]